MSSGRDHCAALSMKSSLHDSSNSIAWSRKGSARNDGIFRAHLIDMKSILAADSYVASWFERDETSAR